MMSRGTERKYKEGTGVTIEIPPDPRYTSLAKLCENERKYGIQEQIKIKNHMDSQRKELEKSEQARYREHWNEVNRVADQMDFNKRMDEAYFVREEMHKLEAKRLREYAEAQIEKERMRKLNQKLNERNQRFDLTK